MSDRQLFFSNVILNWTATSTGFKQFLHVINMKDFFSHHAATCFSSLWNLLPRILPNHFTSQLVEYFYFVLPLKKPNKIRREKEIFKTPTLLRQKHCNPFNLAGPLSPWTWKLLSEVNCSFFPLLVKNPLACSHCNEKTDESVVVN